MIKYKSKKELTDHLMEIFDGKKRKYIKYYFVIDDSIYYFVYLNEKEYIGDKYYNSYNYFIGILNDIMIDKFDDDCGYEMVDCYLEEPENDNCVRQFIDDPGFKEFTDKVFKKGELKWTMK